MVCERNRDPSKTTTSKVLVCDDAGPVINRFSPIRASNADFDAVHSEESDAGGSLSDWGSDGSDDWSDDKRDVPQGETLGCFDIPACLGLACGSRGETLAGIH